MQATPPSADTLYFTYGANLSRAHMALWCPDAVPLVRVTLPDHLADEYLEDIEGEDKPAFVPTEEHEGTAPMDDKQPIADASPAVNDKQARPGKKPRK